MLIRVLLLYRCRSGRPVPQRCFCLCLVCRAPSRWHFCASWIPPGSPTRCSFPPSFEAPVVSHRLVAHRPAHQGSPSSIWWSPCGRPCLPSAHLNGGEKLWTIKTAPSPTTKALPDMFDVSASLVSTGQLLCHWWLNKRREMQLLNIDVWRAAKGEIYPVPRIHLSSQEHTVGI